MVNYCAVDICRKHVDRTRERVTFFRFPVDRCQRGKWLKQLKRKKINPSLRVCSRHFTSESFEVSPEIFKSIGWTAKVKLKLRDGAVPTELLTSLDESEQQKRQTKQLQQQQQQQKQNLISCTPICHHYINVGNDAIDKLNKRQLLLRSDLEDEDAPRLQRELRLEMVGPITSDNPVVKIEVDEDSPCPQSGSSLRSVVEAEDAEAYDESDENDAIFEPEVIVDENYDPANVKIEVEDENYASFAPEFVQDRSAPERCVKVEIVEEADESLSLAGSLDTVSKMAVTVDASIQTVLASDEAGDKRIKKITINFMSARKRQKMLEDVATQTPSGQNPST